MRIKDVGKVKRWGDMWNVQCRGSEESPEANGHEEHKDSHSRCHWKRQEGTAATLAFSVSTKLEWTEQETCQGLHQNELELLHQQRAPQPNRGMSAPLHCAQASSPLGSARATGDGDADRVPALARGEGAVRLHPLMTPRLLAGPVRTEPAARALRLQREGLSPATVHCTRRCRRAEGPGQVWPL